MTNTPLRPLRPGDKKRAAELVEDARKAIAPYRDYRKALAAGYVIYQPSLQVKEYHFVNAAIGKAEYKHFDPTKAGFLIYNKTPAAGGKPETYTLIGMMYEVPIDTSLEEMDKRVPLSITQWHSHNQVCKSGPSGIDWPGNGASETVIPNKRDNAACVAAGGHIVAHNGGWMAHVYPFETDPAKVWKVGMEMGPQGAMPESSK